MCEAEPTRREMLARLAMGAAGAVALGACGTSVATGSSRPIAAPLPAAAPVAASADGLVEVVPGLRIHPRDHWGADLAPTATIERDEVKFLLVHHTASSNTYSDPVPTIRSAYLFHTSPAKGWPDVAYHFFVARDGSVWEGRAGSLDRAVEASATGGNQGWAQLVCLVGNHVDVAPTSAAQASLVQVLKWLTWRYRLDPSATATYVSRGSNKHPAGTTVTTPVISGHRDATLTACPGDAAYALLPTWRDQVAAMPDPEFPDDGPYRRAERLDIVDDEPAAD